LGNSLEDIELLGDPLNKLVIRYKKPGTIASGVMKWFHGWFMRKTEQKLNPDMCIKCGVCGKCCPVQAITLNPYPEFNFDKCIHCWCCAEVCNQGAIKVKVPLATRFVGFN
jgi:ferredoxin